MGDFSGAVADLTAWQSSATEHAERASIAAKLQACAAKLQQQQAKARSTSSALKNDPMVTLLPARDISLSLSLSISLRSLLAHTFARLLSLQKIY
jgi:hypothetical protein